MQQEYIGRREAARRRKRKRRRLIAAGLIAVGILAVLLIFRVSQVRRSSGGASDSTLIQSLFFGSHEPLLEVDWVTQELLTVNPYSRPGIALNEVTGIVVHYVGNPGTTAEQNRNYFESLAESGATYASSHFVISLEGEVIQCIPLDEIAYASNQRNSDTISIECCHPDADGQFNEATYKSLIRLLRVLCQEYRLDADDIIRHYDVTGRSALCTMWSMRTPGNS